MEECGRHRRVITASLPIALLVSINLTSPDLGLDHSEARSWHAWYRHMTLVIAAAAFLAKLGSDLRRSAAGKPNETSPNPPIAA